MKNSRGKNSNILNLIKKEVFWATPFKDFVIERGEGSWIFDIEGKRYLDMMSGQFCLPFGYSDKDSSRHISDQINKIIHLNTTTLSIEVMEGAKSINSLIKYDQVKTFFLSTGAEAVEFAIRNAKFVTSRNSIAVLDKGYHGLTLATQAMSNGGIYAQPSVPKNYYLPTPSGTEDEVQLKNLLRETEAILKRSEGDLAAVVVEPIVSVGGMIFLKKDYLEALEGLANKYGALFIVDESQTGMGRTGKWFAFEYADVKPDMVILAKSIGLGFPVSAVVIKGDVATNLEGRLMHFSSHQNDPLAGSLASYMVSRIRQGKLLEQIRDKGTLILRGLEKIASEHQAIEFPRGLGLMLGFDINLRDDFRSGVYGNKLIKELENRGVILQAVRRGRVFRILPPYTITKEEIEIFLKEFKEALDSIEA